MHFCGCYFCHCLYQGWILWPPWSEAAVWPNAWTTSQSSAFVNVYIWPLKLSACRGNFVVDPVVIVFSVRVSFFWLPPTETESVFAPIMSAWSSLFVVRAPLNPINRSILCGLTSYRISPPHYMAECRKRDDPQGSFSFSVYLIVFVVLSSFFELHGFL